MRYADLFYFRSYKSVDNNVYAPHIVHGRFDDVREVEKHKRLPRQ